MKKQEFTIPSSDGKSQLRCLLWLPDEEVRAVLQVTHGMIEHIGRYDAFARDMAKRGIAVYGHDHLGHGKTASPNDKGYFADENGQTYLIKDLRRLTIYGKKKFPDKPLFLLGHSMGSFFVRRYLTVYSDGPDGVILMGTGGQSQALCGFGWLLAMLVCAVKGPRYRSKLLHKITLGAYNQRFAPTKTNYDWLSRDEEEARNFEADELCQFTFTAGAYRDFLEIILKLTRAEKMGSVRTDIPMLFISGDRDPVGDNGLGVKKVVKRYLKAGVKDLNLGLYKDARHELLNEINRLEVYEDIASWIVNRIV